MISVIIPAYNASAFLEECLQSVLAQTPPGGAEVIVIDDGSTDNTAEIARGCEGVRVISTTNRGVSAARNEGIAQASGEWVTFVDADDCLLPGAFDTFSKSLRGSNADIHVFQFTYGRKVSRGDSVSLSGRDALAATLYQQSRWHCSPWGKLYRRSLFDTVLFTPDLRYEDLELTARIYPLAGHIVSHATTVYHYRQHTGSFIHTFNEHRLDVLKVTERIEAACADDPELLKAARSRRFSACFNIWLECLRHNKFDGARHLCRSEIVRLRHEILLDPKVRLKNRLAALLSYPAGF